MAIFKCKMCGGDLEVTSGLSVAECEYCGTQQTLPKLDDDKKANLYDRAGHFRRNNEFDKAVSIYEKILEEDRTDAEAYWSLVLCKYGIEYVEDPTTRKRVPTVNRAQYTSIFADIDYKSALEYADAYQKSVYESEAKAIDDIQKGILEISNKEDPFDVFICYKETDSNGRRTPDSVLANDLYHQLTNEGFKVFFSRITLEDKIGTAYEPYIFAALNSSKVMVVLGTNPEYFNAVWVKNEWSRYLSLIKSGKNKILIPAYKDMDPYDLPEEFSHLQAQDMGKLGFMQDLIRGIQKLTSSTEKSATSSESDAMQTASGNIAPLLDRSFLCIEDGEFTKADELLEQVLNLSPREPKAYIGKLLCELKLKKEEELASLDEPLWNYGNYNKAVRFAEGDYAKQVQGYNDIIIKKINNKIQEIENKLSPLVVDMNNKQEECNVIYERIKEYNNLIQEQNQKKAEAENTIKEECKLIEKQYDELSFQRKRLANSVKAQSIFQRKQRAEMQETIDQIDKSLEQINGRIRDIKKNMSSNPFVEECDNVILQLKKKTEKESTIISQIQSKIFVLNKEISALKSDKEKLEAMLEHRE